MGQNDENTERGFLRRLRGGLAKTRTQLAAGLGNLFLGKKAIDDDVLADLETSLLRADVGVEATQRIMDALAQRVKRKQLDDTEALVRRAARRAGRAAAADRAAARRSTRRDAPS